MYVTYPGYLYDLTEVLRESLELVRTVMRVSRKAELTEKVQEAGVDRVRISIKQFFLRL